MAWPSCRVTCLVTLGAALWLSHGQVSASLEPLRTVATLSPRPAGCVLSKQERGVWRSAADVGAAQVCWQLARINGVIQRDPKLAGELLTRLRTDVSSTSIWRRVPSLEVALHQLEARAALAEGEPQRAWDVFESVRRTQPLSQWPAQALRDYAVSAATTGRANDAATLYRRVMTVAAWLPARERSTVQLEAAMALVRAAGLAADGAESSDAASYFEAATYVESLDAQRTDTRATELATAINEIARALAEAASSEAGASREAGASSAGTWREAPYSGRSLRGAARLPEQDWRLIETWIEWRTTQDIDVWSWLTDASVPSAYRALARRASGGR